MTSPFTELQGLAISLHEIFVSFIEAGFSREEALQLVIAAVIENKKN